MTILWYTTRTTGEAALLFLTAVLTFGVMSAMRIGGRRVPRFVIAGMHRNLTLIGLGFLAVHIVSTLLDSYAPVAVVDVVVPFGSAYRPVWLGLGTLAFDTLLVLTVTSLLRARIGFRRWKALHWIAYACWATALVHALGTGSDTKASAFLLLAGVCCAIALAAVGWRLAEAGPDLRALRVGAALTALTVVAAIATWAVRGPLEPGWAKRSGTPTNLLRGNDPTAGGDGG